MIVEKMTIEQNTCRTAATIMRSVRVPHALAADWRAAAAALRTTETTIVLEALRNWLAEQRAGDNKI